MLFYPKDAPVPAEWRTQEFLLRPLRATDVELDYAALMVSKEMLRQWSQSSWPADDFSLEGNLRDLERHEKEHLERVAFTFTVMNPTETECLGCVYINSLERVFRWMKASKTDLAAVEDFEVVVAFWVKQSRLADDLDRRLLDTLLAWFEREWVFARVFFDTNDRDTRRMRLLAEAGLQLCYVLDMPNKAVKHLIYGCKDAECQ
jgi:RimJ/RimL family protein N-acetyltransferase